MHIMSGKKPAQFVDDAMEEVYLDNLKYAAERLEEVSCVKDIINK